MFDLALLTLAIQFVYMEACKGKIVGVAGSNLDDVEQQPESRRRQPSRGWCQE
jgi:hypothetical protein